VAAVLVAGGVALGNASALEWRDEWTVLHRMLQVDPEALTVHIRLAYLLEQEGRGEEALEHLQAANRYAVSQKDRHVARESLAVFLGVAGRLDEAERLLAEVLREDPSRAKAWTNLGNVALTKGDPARALQCYQRALSLSPRDGEVAWNLALAQDAVGDATGAAASRRLAAELGVVAR
jgi:tetratricopeptide (TPR) repeat protein